VSALTPVYELGDRVLVGPYGEPGVIDTDAQLPGGGHIYGIQMAGYRLSRITVASLSEDTSDPSVLLDPPEATS
jgi:hypothetical protein